MEANSLEDRMRTTEKGHQAVLSAEITRVQRENQAEAEKNLLKGYSHKGGVQMS